MIRTINTLSWDTLPGVFAHWTFAVLAAICSVPSAAAAELAVSSDFPGGSAEVVSVQPRLQHVTIRPAGDPERGWPCWWYVRLDGLRPGAPLSVTVDASQLKQATGKPLAPDWALPDQASFSDDGATWRPTGQGRRAGAVSTWTLQPTQKRVWVAWGPPFTLDDAQTLTTQMATGESGRVFRLCRTRAGRPVPAVLVTDVPAEQRDSAPVVWVQARQHAWESGASWVARGFGRWLVSDTAAAESLRERALIYLVPIMDVDNVETGNGGKNQLPQDHNRDWSSEPHWPAVKAAMHQLQSLQKSHRVVLFIDLHNPGPNDRQPFYFIPPKELLTEPVRDQLSTFLQLSREEIRGPLSLAPSPRVSGAGYDLNWQKISKNWVARELKTVAVTLETSWNTPASTPDGYGQVGRELGRAVSRFLE